MVSYSNKKIGCLSERKEACIPMTILPGWDLSGVHRQLVLGVSRRRLVFIFLLALTEILAFVYSGRAGYLESHRRKRRADASHEQQNRLLRALIILELSGQEIFVHPQLPAGRSNSELATTHQDCLRKNKAYRSSVGI